MKIKDTTWYCPISDNISYKKGFEDGYKSSQMRIKNLVETLKKACSLRCCVSRDNCNTCIIGNTIKENKTN